MDSKTQYQISTKLSVDSYFALYSLSPGKAQTKKERCIARLATAVLTLFSLGFALLYLRNQRRNWVQVRKPTTTQEKASKVFSTIIHLPNLEKAAKEKDTAAIELLRDCYKYGVGGVKKDLNKEMQLSQAYVYDLLLKTEEKLEPSIDRITDYLAKADNEQLLSFLEQDLAQKDDLEIRWILEGTKTDLPSENVDNLIVKLPESDSAQRNYLIAKAKFNLPPQLGKIRTREQCDAYWAKKSAAEDAASKLLKKAAVGGCEFAKLLFAKKHLNHRAQKSTSDTRAQKASEAAKFVEELIKNTKSTKMREAATLISARQYVVKTRAYLDTHLKKAEQAHQTSMEKGFEELQKTVEKPTKEAFKKEKEAHKKEVDKIFDAAAEPLKKAIALFEKLAEKGNQTALSNLLKLVYRDPMVCKAMKLDKKKELALLEKHSIQLIKVTKYSGLRNNTIFELYERKYKDLNYEKNKEGFTNFITLVENTVGKNEKIYQILAELHKKAGNEEKAKFYTEIVKKLS